LLQSGKKKKQTNAAIKKGIAQMIRDKMKEQQRAKTCNPDES
jgi:hypothetical protein